MEKSQAREIELLIKKYEKLLKAHYELANFKEPVIFLMRRNGTVTFHEDATKGEFEFVNSADEKQRILLDGRTKTFKYGKKTFQGYILHEDHATQIPQEPILIAEEYNTSIQNTLNTNTNWRAKEQQAIGMKWQNIAIGIAIIICAIAVFVMIFPESAGRFIPQSTTIIQQVSETARANLSQAPIPP